MHILAIQTKRVVISPLPLTTHSSPLHYTVWIAEYPLFRQHLPKTSPLSLSINSDRIPEFLHRFDTFIRSTPASIRNLHSLEMFISIGQSWTTHHAWINWVPSLPKILRKKQVWQKLRILEVNFACLVSEWYPKGTFFKLAYMKIRSDQSYWEHCSNWKAIQLVISWWRHLRGSEVCFYLL